MATWKLTARMGKTKADVTVGAGTAIAGSDAIELNVDATNMSKAQFVATLDQLTARAIELNYPAA